MSSTQDPMDAPSLPRRRTGPGLWSLAAFGVICVLAGFGVAEFAPRLAATPFTLGGLAPPKPGPASSAPGISSPLVETPILGVQPGGVAGLSARLESLEAQQSAARQTAAAAVAAATLLDAAQSSRPFVRELAALRAVAPPSADLAALEKLAETGAPSRATLAVEFPAYAAKAVSASPKTGSRFWTAVNAISSRFITLRHLEATGSGVDAILARAEQQINNGEVDQALRLVDSLPPASRAAMDPWRALALDRAELDRRVSAVRLEAVESLARLSEGGA